MEIKCFLSLATASLLIFILGHTAFAQQPSGPTGFPLKNTFDSHDLDSVNLNTLNVHVEIPLLSRKERGQIVNTLSLVYDNQDWEVDFTCYPYYCDERTVPGPAMQWKLAGTAYTATFAAIPRSCTGWITGEPIYFWQVYSIDVFDSHNTRHHMVPDPSDDYQGVDDVGAGSGEPTSECFARFQSPSVYAADGSGLSILNPNGGGTNDTDLLP